MGFWGEKIFENDFTLDVKDTIESGLSIGVSIREIIGDLKNEIDFDMLSIIEQNLFWIASSTTLWENGRKDSKLFKKGIESIDLFLSDYQVSEELKAELVGYRNKLHNQPPKKRTKRPRYICPWKIGDVFALPIEKDENVDNGLNGRYFIFIKRDERVYEKNVYPIVEVKITKDNKIPTTYDEINNLEAIVIWRLSRGLHLMISYLDDINHEIYIDEDGQYPLKYYEISGTSNDEIPDKIIFIGNYDDLELPTKTNFFLDEHKSSYSGNFWKDVEKRLIAKVYINNSYLLDE